MKIIPLDQGFGARVADFDLLVWNNLAVQHARTKVAPMSAGRRIMQRVALGKHTFSDQLEKLTTATA